MTGALSENLFITFAALVKGRVEYIPLALHVLVGLHLHLALAPLNAVGVISRNKVREYQCVGTLRTIFGQHSDEQ